MSDTQHHDDKEFVHVFCHTAFQEPREGRTLWDFQAREIDRSLTARVRHDQNPLIAPMIASAKSLSLNVVAAGVDVDEQRAFLHEIGCDAIQGYLVAKPLPAAVFEQQILRQRKLSKRFPSKVTQLPTRRD